MLKIIRWPEDAIVNCVWKYIALADYIFQSTNPETVLVHFHDF